MEGEIVSYLRSIGATVSHLSASDVPDLLIGFQGRTLLFEVKSKGAELREGQREFARRWKGDPVRVVRNTNDAIKALFPGEAKDER